MAPTRRIFLAAGGLVILSAAAAASGSLLFCARGSKTVALPLDRLDVAMEDMVAPERIARAVRATARSGALEAELANRPAILASMEVECRETRRGLIRAAVRGEFANGDTVVADRFVISRSEGLIAALRAA